MCVIAERRRSLDGVLSVAHKSPSSHTAAEAIRIVSPEQEGIGRHGCLVYRCSHIIGDVDGFSSS